MVQLHYKLYKKQRSYDGINWVDIEPVEYVKIPIDYSSCGTKNLPYLVYNGAHLLYQLTSDGVLTENEALAYSYYAPTPAPSSYRIYNGNLVITSAVTEIGSEAFSKHIAIPNTSVVYFGSAIGSIDLTQATNLTKIGYNAFYKQRFSSQSGSVITMPDSLEIIDEGAFESYRGNVVFSSNSSINHLGTNSFKSASVVFFLNPTPPSATTISSVFGNNTNIIVPCEYLSTYRTKWKSISSKIRCQ